MKDLSSMSFWELWSMSKDAPAEMTYQDIQREAKKRKRDVTHIKTAVTPDGWAHILQFGGSLVCLREKKHQGNYHPLHD